MFLFENHSFCKHCYSYYAIICSKLRTFQCRNQLENSECDKRRGRKIKQNETIWLTQLFKYVLVFVGEDGEKESKGSSESLES